MKHAFSLADVLRSRAFSRAFSAGVAMSVAVGGCAMTDDASNGATADRFAHGVGTTAMTGGAHPGLTPQTFTALATPPLSPWIAQVLTDGRVIAQDYDTNNWWTLTPDNTGSYSNGSWTQIASGPTGYTPLYFASAVLADGRFITEGGEYIGGTEVDSGSGAIYDPTMDMWTAIAEPSTFSQIGDGESVVLADGRFMLADCCTTAEAILDPTNLTWTPIGGGKEDINDEEGWTLLPDGRVLTVDANNTANDTESEIFDPTTGTWSSLGSTVVELDDLNTSTNSHELGPQVLRPDGTVLAIGATGHNAVFDSATGTWAAAPDFPTVAAGQLDSADGPAALLPNGNVVVTTSPGIYQIGAEFFEWDGTQFNAVGGPTSAASTSSYQYSMVVLPTGEVLLTSQSTDVEIYEPTPATNTAAIEPAITTVPLLENKQGLPRAVVAQLDTLEQTSANQNISPYLLPLMDIYTGRTYTVTGARFNGISQGAAYGDDAQSSTAFPLVRFTNQATGDVQYARTHDGTNFGVSLTNTSSTHVDIPATIEGGLSTMQVVANGIASPGLLVNVK
jgi:hypothetical protein